MKKEMSESTQNEIKKLSKAEKRNRLVLRIGHPAAVDSYSMYDLQTDSYAHTSDVGISSRKKFDFEVEDFRDDSMKHADDATFNKAVHAFHQDHPGSQLIEYDSYVWFKEIKTVLHPGGLSLRTILPKARETIYRVDGAGNLKECRDIYA